MGVGSQRSRDVRPAAVAGLFYPGERDDLGRSVDSFVAAAGAGSGRQPLALVAPHAGYPYSGPIAGSAFALLEGVTDRFDRAVVLGPSHYVPVRGIALPTWRAFETPSGCVELDRDACEALARWPVADWDDTAHAREHSLEVELPFLQRFLPDLPIVPLAVGDIEPEAMADVVDELWTERTLLVVSTDLSHFLDYESACRVDSDTAKAIVAGDVERIGPRQACGARALAGLLVSARRRGLGVECLDLRNSGDTSGDRSRVVGYGAFVVSKANEAALPEA